MTDDDAQRRATRLLGLYSPCPSMGSGMSYVEWRMEFAEAIATAIGEAVLAALEEACRRTCVKCLDAEPVTWDMARGCYEHGDYTCRASAIRRKMEEVKGE
jgi:hypothetical protein